MISRIRRGDQVRDEAVLLLQPALWRMAWRAYQRHSLYHNEEQALEPADLVQAANVRLLEKFSRARLQDNPLAWLCIVAANAMRDCMNGRSDAIKREPGRRAIPLLPFSTLLRTLPRQDATPMTLEEVLAYEVRLPPVEPAANESPLACLMQAIAALPEKQRIIMERHLGLDGSPPVSLRQLSREFAAAGSRKPSSAEYHYRRALRTLRQSLSYDCLPQHPTTGGIR